MIPIEHVEHSCRGIRVRAPVFAGESVFPPAEDVCKRRAHLLKRGAIVAAQGLRSWLLPVTRRQRSTRPRYPAFWQAAMNWSKPCPAALRADSKQQRPGPARAGNRIWCAGANLRGVAPDVPPRCARDAQSARAGADLIITTGGAGRGERDYMKAILADLRARISSRSGHAAAAPPDSPLGGEFQFSRSREIPPPCLFHSISSSARR